MAEPAIFFGGGENRLITAVSIMAVICLAHAQTKCPCAVFTSPRLILKNNNRWIPQRKDRICEFNQGHRHILKTCALATTPSLAPKLNEKLIEKRNCLLKIHSTVGQKTKTFSRLFTNANS